METTNVVPFRERLSAKRIEAYQRELALAVEEERDVLKAMRQMKNTGMVGVYALEYLVRCCCLEPALIIPGKFTGHLVGFGLMERDGTIRQSVRDIVRVGGDTQFMQDRRTILDHLHMR